MRKYPPPQIIILLLFVFLSFTLFAQTKTITGIVKDSSNQPLAAATVTVKGKKFQQQHLHPEILHLIMFRLAMQIY